MKFRKYRVVRDSYLGYEVQVWRLWFPFWVQCDFANTFSSIDQAKEAIKYYREQSVYEE